MAWAALQGSWRLARTITHRRSGAVFAVSGTAQWQPQAMAEADGAAAQQGASYLYSEAGTLSGPGIAGASTTQQYDYRRAAEPGAEQLQIFFVTCENRGKLFLDLTFTAGDEGANSAPGLWAAHSSHFCPPDTYDATFKILGPDSIAISYSVTGPKKDYLSETTYQRIAAADP